MHQLILPTLFMLLVGTAMVPLGLRLARRRTWWQACLLVALVAAMLSIHMLYLLDNLRLAQWLPIADCMFYTNLSIPLSALVASLAWPVLRLPAWRKLAILLFVVFLGLERSYAPMLGRRPDMKAATWHGDVCQQTTLSTCVPAACATLLTRAGIPATEQELATLCFTAESGSSILAAYRGLKIKTARTAYDAVAFVGSAAELRRQRFVGGVISIEFDLGEKPLIPRNARHELAIWSFNDNGSATIADPLSGTRLAWPASEFDRSWPGQGVFLRRR
jgi:hypothetical protein